MNKKRVLLSIILILLVSFVYALEPGKLWINDVEIPYTVEDVEEKCTDSDGGRNYYVKGTTAGSQQLIDSSGNPIHEPIEETDKCSNLNSNDLFEYSCIYTKNIIDGSYGYFWTSETYTCPNGCQDGACIVKCSPGQIIGDVDGDGKITAYDASLAARIAEGFILKPDDICCVDVNQDGEITYDKDPATEDDAQLIAEIAVGKREIPGFCGYDASISIATLKDIYKVGEKIELTDPPDEVNFNENKIVGNIVDEENIKISYSDIKDIDYKNNLELTIKDEEKVKPNYKGYIVEFKDKPVLEKKIDLEKEAKENQEYIDKSSWYNPIALYKKTFSVFPDDIEEEIKDYSNNLDTKHTITKNKILTKLSKNKILNKITGNVVKESEIELLGEYKDVFNGVALDISDEEVMKLKEIPEVKEIHPNYEVNITLTDSVPLINADDVWKLDENGNDCAETGKECLTGKDVTIAIIDTGVDYTHPDLGGCIGERENQEFCVIDNFCNQFSGTLNLGEEKNILFNGVNLNISVEFIGPICISLYCHDAVKFRINNYYTYTLFEHESYMLDIGYPIYVENIFFQDFVGGERYVDFIIGENERSCPSDCFSSNNQNCKVIGGYDFINNDNDPMDDHGHGTHVAATAAGNGALKGVAPDTKIYAYKVLDSRGNGWDDDIIAAIERSIDPNQDNDFSDYVDIISMSLGGYGNPDDAVSKAVDNAVNNGIVAVIAAGNDGPYSETIGSPGTARKAITVGASDKDDLIAYFSSRGPVIWKDQNKNTKILIKPDIVAPGVDICAAQYDNAWQDRQCLDEEHTAISGTSMATPHVAGAVALLKQKNPDWSPEEIKSALKNTAVDIGEDIITQGYGRINILKAINSARPLVAELEPLDYVLSEKIDIIGTAKGDNFDYYELYYGEEEKNNWNLICNKDKEVEKNVLCSDFNPKNLLDGKYYLKLIVYGKLGQKSEDRNLFKIDFVNIKNPLNNDIYRAGDIINLIGNIGMNFSNYFVEFKKIEDSTWSRDGISFEEIKSIKDGVLAKWDTSRLEKGFYDLKLTINSSQETIEEYVKEIYLDPTLKKSWPQKIEYYYFPCPWDDTESCYAGAMFEPAVSDLNNDGEKEVIFYIPGYPQKLQVFRQDGSLYCLKDVGKPEYDSYSNLHMPVVGDINNDGFNEIIIWRFFFGDSELYVFDKNCDIIKGWPIKLPDEYSPTLLMADLDLDGNKEIVVKGNGAIDRKMVIIDNKGKIISQWDLPDISHGATIEGSPAVGNFDDDPELEIVVAGPSENDGPVYDEDGNYVEFFSEGIIHVYNTDGSVVKGWPQYIPGYIFSSPVVGDINNDGNLEIVVGLMYDSLEFPDENYGGLYAFDKNGNVLPEWPVEKGYNFWSTPSLGDIDNDGDLEIAASKLGGVTYLFHHDGTLVNGWPQFTSWNDYYSSIIGDINSDGELDVLTTAGGNYHCPDNCGGVYAWNFDGSIIDGFPKVTEIDAQAPATISDIDNDGKIELIASSNHDYDKINQEGKRRGSVYVWELDGNYDENKMPWPMFMHDPQHTGNYHFKEKEKPQSKITNNESFDLKGYLYINIEKHAFEDYWGVYKIVVSDHLRKKDNNNPRIIPAKGLLKLDKLFNMLNVKINEPGKYRIIAEFKDGYNEVIKTKDSELRAEWEFEVIE